MRDGVLGSVSPNLQKPLFVFYQFNGDNGSYCNLKCPYCYQPKKRMVHEWNPNLDWERAFERLNQSIYFNVCYGEPMVGNGFYDVLDIIGRHSNWECNLITNLTQSPTRMIQSRLAKDGRLYVLASWHPLGGANWETFKEHLLELQASEIKTVVMYVLYPPQKELWKRVFPWFDTHNIRTYVRRYYGEYAGEHYPEAYPQDDRQFLEAMAHNSWKIKYCVNMASTFGHLCSAGMDKILIHSDGQVSNCADVCNNNLGNIFDPTFKLNTEPKPCPTTICGGDHGKFTMIDEKTGSRLELEHDGFIIPGTDIKGGGREPVQYPNRAGMMKWLTT